MRKYIISSFIGIYLLLCGISCNVAQVISNKAGDDMVSLHGKLRVSGTTLVDAKSDTISLHGVSLGWHNWWPRFYDSATVTWLKDDWKIKVVRAAIGVEPDGAYLQNPEVAMQKLYEVIDAAIANGVYVIVDWHAHHIHTSEAKLFFQTVARKYHAHPNIIYEIYNEPMNTSWEEIKKYAEEIIPAIRAIDPDNIILVGCPNWDQDIHLVADDPLVGFNNLMYTVHFYAGTHKQFLRDRADYALSKSIPIFISECAGMNADGDGDIDLEEWQLWKEWAQKNKISWIAWSIADKNESCSMIANSHVPSAGWSLEQLKTWGKLVRQDLRNMK